MEKMINENSELHCASPEQSKDELSCLCLTEDRFKLLADSIYISVVTLCIKKQII
jgi:hypothetical protein